ncbi:MAG TPA: DivIVA domain-containing protein, partial [Actinomycetota bacterium]|nr:DivIVA domain-containing protein [Actinomycetota bacterium]
MAAIRLDHPVLVSGAQIRRREFVTTRRGYDANQVRRYLDEIADQVDLMGSMIREARLEAETAARAGAHQPDPYEQLAQRVASVLREADDTAERILTQGRVEADRVVTEARGEADRIRTDAQSQAEKARAAAERALGQARDEADRAISGLSTRRQLLVDQLAQMRERLLGVARDLESTIVATAEPPGEEAPAPGVVVADRGTEPSAVATEPPGEPDEPVEERVVDVRDDPAASAPLIVADEILEAADPTAEE